MAEVYLQNKVNDHVLGGPDYTRPATLYYAALVGGVEISAGGYARASVTNDATSFPASSGGSKTNGTVVEIGPASVSWGNVTQLRIYDAASGGNALVTSAAFTAIAVGAGDTLRVPIGTATFTVA